MSQHRLDARGLKCPLPVLKARRVLESAQPGDRLLVTASDPAARRDFPEFCDAAGHRLDAMDTAADGTITLSIVKGSKGS